MPLIGRARRLGVPTRDMIPPELSSSVQSFESPVSHSRVAEAQADPQHAAGRPAEAEAVAGGADPVWEVPRCQLAGPGRTRRLLLAATALPSFDTNTNAGECSVEQHGIISLPLRRCSISFYFTVGWDLPNPLETCSSSRLEYRPGCYTLQKLGHTHR